MITLAPSAEPTAATPVGPPPARDSSFYAGMRILPKAARKAIFDVYAFCRAVDDVADDLDGAPEDRRRLLNAWRVDLDDLYADRPARQAAYLISAVRRYDLSKDDFLAVIDGMEMDVDGPIQAPSQATLDLYVDRVACAVGRLSVKIFGMEEEPGLQLAHHLGRALQFTNIVRDVDEDAAMARLYLPRELLAEAGVNVGEPSTVLRDPRLERAIEALARIAEREYGAAQGVLRLRPQGRLLAPKLMAAVYRRKLAKMTARGWRMPRTAVKLGKGELAWAVVRDGVMG